MDHAHNNEPVLQKLASVNPKCDFTTIPDHVSLSFSLHAAVDYNTYV